MAKGNMLLGYSRGSVGDVTFYRAGGSQRQRARNRNPNNPRTPAQMAQRSIFANAVKFFKQVNTGFFRYAFEDKKPNESDYNAFMRHNVVNSGYIGARASKISDWPALGLWELSAGSLPEITAPFPQPRDTGAGLYFSVGVLFPNDPNTIGELSAALINGAPNTWRVGDILTCVMYRATYANTLPTTDTDEEHRAVADYMQIILNPNDNTPLDNVTLDLAEVSFKFSPDAEGLYIVGTTPIVMDLWPRDLFGFSVIHSRNTASGLQVSPSTMVYNKRELPLLAMSSSGAYYSEVLADWQASAQAILEGAEAKGAQMSNLPFAYINPSFLSGEYEVIDLQGGYVPDIENVIFNLGTADNINTLMLQFFGSRNEGKAIETTDPSKFRFDGLQNATFNAGRSTFAPQETQIFFEFTAITRKPDTPIVVYYDSEVILKVTFS